MPAILKKYVISTKTWNVERQEDAYQDTTIDATSSKEALAKFLKLQIFGEIVDIKEGDQSEG